MKNHANIRDFGNLIFLVALGVLFKVAASYGTMGLYVFSMVIIVYSSGFVATKFLILPLMRGSRCPHCREKSLAYRGCLSFGHRFYECIQCGRLMKRRGSGVDWEPATVEELGTHLDPVGSSWRPLSLGPGVAGKVARGIYALSLVIGLFLGGYLGYAVAGVGGFVMTTLFSAWFFLDHLWKKVL